MLSCGPWSRGRDPLVSCQWIGSCLSGSCPSTLRGISAFVFLHHLVFLKNRSCYDGGRDSCGVSSGNISLYAPPVLSSPGRQFSPSQWHQTAELLLVHWNGEEGRDNHSEDNT